MSSAFEFECKTCGETHVGMPALSADAPLYYDSIPVEERQQRCSLNSDICVVDSEFFFVRCNILIPVHGIDQPLMWGVWVSLSHESFSEYLDHLENEDRAGTGPYFGWLSAEFPVYPTSENLKTMLHIQPHPTRPRVELEPTDHPLAIEQRMGISQGRLAEIYTACLHG